MFNRNRQADNCIDHNTNTAAKAIIYISIHWRQTAVTEISHTHAGHTHTHTHTHARHTCLSPPPLAIAQLGPPVTDTAFKQAS